MKTLRKIMLMLAMCVISLTVFVSCSCTDNFDNTGVGNVTASQTVGNGGLAVISGRYLYFANGYSSKTENYGDNKLDSQTKGAVYRVLLTDAKYLTDGTEVVYNGGEYEIETETLTDKDDNEVENRNIKDAQLIVSKKIGFEYGGFYIFGEFIYYITPSNKYNKDGSQRTNEVEFYRIRTNGKNNELITTIDNYNENSRFAFYHYKGDVYGVIYSGGKIVLTKNNKEIKSKEEVSSVILPSKTNFDLLTEKASGYEGTDKVVSFLSGTKLWTYKIGDSDFSEKVNLPSGSSLIENLGRYDGVYYMAGGAVYKHYATGGELLFYTESTDIKMMEPGIFISKENSKVYKYLSTSKDALGRYLKQNFIEEDVKIESYSGGDCYYIKGGEEENKEVIKINVHTNEKETVFTPEKNGTLKTDSGKNIYILGSWVYYYRLNSDEFKTQGYYLEVSTSTGSFVKTPLGFKTGDDNLLANVED